MGSYGAETEILRQGTGLRVLCISKVQRKVHVLGIQVPTGWFCSFKRGSGKVDNPSVGKYGDWKLAGLILTRTPSKKGRNRILLPPVFQLSGLLLEMLRAEPNR